MVVRNNTRMYQDLGQSLAAILERNQDDRIDDLVEHVKESVRQAILLNKAPTPLAVMVRDAAKLIGVSTDTVYDLMNSGSLSSFYIGRRRLIRVTDLELFIDTRAKAAQEKDSRDGSRAEIERLRDENDGLRERLQRK